MIHLNLRYIARLISAVAIGMGLVQLVLAQSGAGDRGISRQIEREVNRQVEREVGRQVERQVNQRVEEQVARQVDQQIQSDVASPKVPEHATDALQALNPTISGMNQRLAPRAVPSVVGSALAVVDGNHKPARRPYAIERFHDVVEDEAGFQHLRDQWLVLGDEARVQELLEAGMMVKSTTALTGLGQMLIEIEHDGRRMPKNSGDSERSSYDSDHNHLYRYQSLTSANRSGNGWAPTDALKIIPPGGPIKIGLIDSHVDLGHAALRHTSMKMESFIEHDLTPPYDHGTAVASILAGKSRQFTGLLPEADIYAAGVFYDTAEHGSVASIKSILLALDWMIKSNITVVNMSLAGPPNAILESAMKQAKAKGLIIVAAAGNGGPGAAFAYPAAYPEVVAVTAVDQQKLAYYRANHGPYIDFAAPGVSIEHAINKREYGYSSGTSYATPFVTAALAYLVSNHSNKEAHAMLIANIKDLGVPGFDSIYGHGLIQMPNQ